MVLRTAPQGAATLFAGEVAARTLSFLAIWLVVGHIGADAYAPVAVALAVLVVASLVTELGLPLIGAREIARVHRAESSLTAAIVWTQVGVAAALCLCFACVSAFGLVDPTLARLLPGYGLSLLLLPFLTPWIFQGLGAMAWIATVGVTRQMVFLVCVAALVHGPAQAVMLPLAEILAVAAAGGLAQLVLRWKLGVFTFMPLASPTRAMLAEGGAVNASQLLWVARMYLAVIMLWNTVPPSDVSSFDISHRIMLVLQALLTTYMTSLYPEIVRTATRSPALLGARIRRSMLWTSSASVVVAVLVAALAPVVLALFMPASVATPKTYSCTAVLAAVMPVLAIRGHARLVLLTAGRARWELGCSVANFAVLPVFVALGIAQGGVVGAAIGLVAAEATGAGIAAIAMTTAVSRWSNIRPAAS